MGTPYRYRLQPYAGSRKNRYACPGCEKQRTFTRWLDTQTGELLPEPFGRCDRVSNCGYSLSPYDKGPTGISYADAQREASPFTWLRNQKKSVPRPASPLCVIPEDVLQQSLGHYERNNFAQLLQTHFGRGVALDLLRRFEIGTSAYWPGATVFWQRDELGRVRGGQVVLFDSSGHTAKLPGADGKPERCTKWVHTAYAQACRRQQQPQPAWLSAYLNEANKVAKSPSLYGLPQLLSAAIGQPVAIVEAAKTAVICSAYFPEFIWLAVGSLSYLTLERLQLVKGFPITLFPDASTSGSAFNTWGSKAVILQQSGFRIQTSNLLERSATTDQKAAGIDLADLLLDQWAGYPPSWD